MAKTTLTAADLVELLAQRHDKDVFVAECKTGSTWDGCRRLDAWVLQKTWTPWTIWGYEVKVSRSDFEQDQKWLEYLPYCHRFSFVCPGGLIRATDLPPGVGLVWASANGAKLFTKVQAARRQPDHEKLTELMSYVLMSRARIVNDMWEANGREVEPRTREERMERWRKALAKVARDELCHLVGGHVAARWGQMRDRERASLSRESDTKRLIGKLAEVGIVLDGNDRWCFLNAEREIDRLAGAIPPGFVQEIRGIRRQLEVLEGTIAKIREQTAISTAKPGE